MQRRFFRKYLTFIPVLFGTGMFFSCENDIKEIERITMKSDAPQERFEEVTLIYKDSIFTRAILTAPLVNRYYGKDERMEFPEGLEVNFYQPEMIRESRLTSKFGRFSPRINELEVRNNVVFINFLRTDTLFTEALTWSQNNPDTSKIHTDKFVMIKTKKAVLQSQGLYADETFSSYTFIQPKTTYFYSQGN